MNAINTKTAKTSELVAFYNAHSDKPVKKFTDRATAEARVTALLKTLKPAKPAKANRSNVIEREIQVLVEANPKREGTKSYERFAIYADGMSTEEFKRLGGRAKDLKWDERHGFIQLIG